MEIMVYRTPRLEEFTTGFAYQVYSEGYHEDSIEDFCGWYSYNFQQGLCFRDLEDIKRELNEGNIRAECLPDHDT